MAATIEVLDAIMGSGKTTGIIKWMKDNPQNKYLYVSPLLSEVEERIPVECEVLDFISPNTINHKTKSEHLLELLQEGSNISFTHSLFTSLTREHLRVIEREGYILVVDEEIDFIDQYQGNDYKREDIVTLEKSGHIVVREDQLGRIEWTWDENNFEDKSTYGKLKRMCDLQMLHCAKRDRGMIVVHLPIALLEAAQRNIVMTYLFNGSIMHKFMEMRGVIIKDFTEIQLIKTEAQVKVEASDKIEFIDTPSTRKVGNISKSRFTSSWYKESATSVDLKQVESAIHSVCRKYKKDFVMYTLPKQTVLPDNGKPKIRIKGYSAKDCYLYAGTKATNKYSHKNVIIHAFNRHPVVPVSAYLHDYGFPIDSDHFALSELVQFIWRSDIRNGNKVYLCIIPLRMRLLFNQWLDCGL